MPTRPHEPSTSELRRRVIVRMLGLLLLVWAAFASAPAVERAEARDRYDVAPPRHALLAVQPGATRAVAPTADAPAPPLLALIRAPELIAAHAAPRRATAERPDPAPSLFSRVSYRTTGPPVHHG